MHGHTLLLLQDRERSLYRKRLDAGSGDELAKVMMY
jgi:hypothetical protein